MFTHPTPTPIPIPIPTSTFIMLPIQSISHHKRTWYFRSTLLILIIYLLSITLSISISISISINSNSNSIISTTIHANTTSPSFIHTSINKFSYSYRYSDIDIKMEMSGDNDNDKDESNSNTCKSSDGFSGFSSTSNELESPSIQLKAASGDIDTGIESGTSANSSTSSSSSSKITSKFNTLTLMSMCISNRLYYAFITGSSSNIDKNSEPKQKRGLYRRRKRKPKFCRYSRPNKVLKSNSLSLSIPSSISSNCKSQKSEEKVFIEAYKASLGIKRLSSEKKIQALNEMDNLKASVNRKASLRPNDKSSVPSSINIKTLSNEEVSVLTVTSGQMLDRKNTKLYRDLKNKKREYLELKNNNKLKNKIKSLESDLKKQSNVVEEQSYIIGAIRYAKLIHKTVVITLLSFI